MTCTGCGLVQVNPWKNLVNVVDNEDSEVREEKFNKLLPLMEKGTGSSLKEIMEKEIETRKGHFKSKLRDIQRYEDSGRLLDVGCAQGG